MHAQVFCNGQLTTDHGHRATARFYGPRGKKSFNNSMASGDEASKSLIASAMGPARACLFTVSIASCDCSSRSSSSSSPLGQRFFAVN
jgi:hypothetical protein